MKLEGQSKAEEALQKRFAGLTYEAIGKSMGLSRQRIQQLLSPPPYIRELVVNRAKGKCQHCGTFVGRAGHVHHKDGDGEDYNDVDNLILLCLPCYMREHTYYPLQAVSQDLDGSNIEYLTTGKISKMLGISMVRVRQLAKRRQFGRKLGRDWLFSPREVEDMRIRRPCKSGRPKQG